MVGGGETSDDGGRHGIATYYGSKCRELDVTIAAKEANLRRLEAQRNELNSRVRVRAPLFALFFPVLTVAGRRCGTSCRSCKRRVPTWAR